MAGRSGRRRVDPSSPLVDLDAVFADDKIVDAISAAPWGELDPHPLVRASVRAGGGRGSVLTVDPLTELLQSWRSELAVTPVPAPPSSVQAAISLPCKLPANRSLRPALAIAAAIAAFLVGSASIGSKNATPDSALWMVTEVLWPNRAESVESVSHVRAALQEAQVALADGRPQDAQIALLRATVELGKVEDVDGRSDMQQSVVELWAQVGPRDLPASTLPSQFATAGPSGAATRQVAINSPVPSTAPPMATAVQVAAPAAAELSPAPAAPTLPALTQAQQVSDLGWPTARSTAASAAGGSSESQPVSTPVASIDPMADVLVGQGTSRASVPSTPSAPTAIVEPVPAVAVADSPVAPQQSGPAPTPSTTTLSVGSTTPAVTGPHSLDDVGTATNASVEAAG